MYTSVAMDISSFWFSSDMTDHASQVHATCDFEWFGMQQRCTEEIFTQQGVAQYLYAVYALPCKNQVDVVHHF
jgi:hypothetical protein